ncbi:uncharacterized protein AB675_386 [Cyphellophora attinorum]|uniref:Uncharacterized protein n=1 Tax=Cyphellophora attinorum TaxID=1664694 RepID=A0A0N0NRY9_9EURO|nr:uncharacterized protein AB675_386 [Phialophora attinorum]KPI45389.1 hypothetical protein AB675_386 [Phialophora attinorum]
MAAAVPIVPGRGLGWMTLGLSLHTVISKIKSHPQDYPNIDLSHSSSHPTTQPIILTLPANGLRLRFDGPDQRLRLVEVLDFSKNSLAYKNTDLVKHARPMEDGQAPDPAQARPSFRHIYNRLFGPAYKGEYTPPETGHRRGTYTLSYPGLAFLFPIDHKSWSDKADFVSMLSSSATGPATSMAIFEGSSWPEARSSLFGASTSLVEASQIIDSSTETSPPEISIVHLRGGGQLEFLRLNGHVTTVQLNETTPQDLVAEFGPPDAIYRKDDSRISIHATAQPHSGRRRSSNISPNLEPIDNASRSSVRSYSGDSDASSISGIRRDEDDAQPAWTAECFYNYFHHASMRSFLIPRRITMDSSSLVVTKIILHGNIPSSYNFNRHRRLRWAIRLPNPNSQPQDPTSETPFSDISSTLRRVWHSTYGSAEEEAQQQRGMVLNRGWGDSSPDSSIEILGGFEEEGKEQTSAGQPRDQEMVSDTTELFGFPGMLFEVLKNDAVSCLTLY